MPESLHSTVVSFLALLLIVFAVAAFVQRVRLPYTIALVTVGFIGIDRGFLDIALTPDLILLVFLPLLLFDGAYNVPANRLRQDIAPVALLAVLGVALGTLVTGAITHLALGLSWGVAFLFGALISSTDPIAVVSLFRDLRAPRRLSLLLEGESLFNDGAAITIFQLVLVGIVTGSFSLGEGIVRLIVTVIGAVAIGGVIGAVVSYLLRVIDAPQVQLTATVIAAYGAYLLADSLTFSGAIAVVVTALVIGNYGLASGITPRSVYALDATWSFLGFVANSLIFLLIGVALDPRSILGHWQIIAIAFLATLGGRAVVVLLVAPLLRGSRALPVRYLPPLIWGGLRGVVSLALVLSIPFTLPGGTPFPGRDTLQIITFGVVGASLLLQGLTMSPLMRRLGLSGGATESADGEEADALRARLAAVEGALLTLAHDRERGEIGALQYERLASAYQTEHEQLQRQLEESAQPSM